MRTDRLILEDFRNYKRETAEFAPGLNVVVGHNAQGKTNLLEAVYCLGGLGSPRAPDASLVRDGAERALLHGLVERTGRVVQVDLEIVPGRGTRALINGASTAGTRALRELSVAVFFGPDELSLIKGSPEGRRRFLDDLVVKLKPAREGLRREWERVLKQRNALLKSAPRTGGASPSARATLEVWDESLARTGAEVTAARLEALGLLSPYAAKRYKAIAGGGRMELSYTSTWLKPSARDAPDAAVIRERLLRSIDEMRARELERGMSLVGPQRDDVTVRLASASGGTGLMDARQFASQGDQRTCALALKLGEHDLLTEALGDTPVLLLDDVFSELDPARRAWLADVVRDTGQTLLSAAEPGAVEAADADRVIVVRGGSLEAEEGGRDGR